MRLFVLIGLLHIGECIAAASGKPIQIRDSTAIFIVVVIMLALIMDVTEWIERGK